MGSYKVCICFRRNFKVNEVEPPFDIKQTFSKYCDGGTLMNAEQLLRFLIEFQGETSATISDAEQIIRHVMHRRHRVSAFNRHVLTTEDFHQFLFSDDLNSPITNQVHHDMTAPLSHYFVYTGHNSYLTGNQLSSGCSDVPIIKALKRGVRVIELDLWPNLKGDNVNVLHGGTLTAPVSLLKCFKSIKEYAFSTSPYPVVITLEDHLTASLQAKVAEMATEIFGDMLFCPDSDGLEKFPSPESLKHRIILSTKPPKEYLEAKKLKDRDASKYNHWSMELLDHSDGLSSDCEHIQDDDVDQRIHKSGQIRAPEYKRLGAIHVKTENGDSEVVKCIQDDDFYESGHEPDQVDSPEYNTPTASPENEENSDGEVTEGLQDNDVNEIKRNSSKTGPIQFKRLKAVSAKKETGDSELSEHKQDDDNVNESSDSELSEIIRDDDVNESKHNSGRVGAPEYKRLTALLVKKENGDSEVIEGIQVSDSEAIECIQEDDVNEIRRNSVQTRAIEFKRLTAISAKKENGDSELAELIFDEDVNKSSDTELSELIQDDDDNEKSFIEVQVGEPEYKRLMTILTRKENGNSDVSECIQEDDVNERGFSDQAGVPEYKRLTAISAKSMDDDELSKFIQDHIVNEIISKRLTAIHAKKENSDDENELIQDDVSIEIRCHADQVGAPDCVRLTAIPSKKKPTLLSELIQYDDVNESRPESEQVESPEYNQSTAKRKKGERKLCELIQEDFVNEKMHELGKGVPDYKRLIAIHARKIKGGMKESLKLDPTRVRRLSLSEQKLLKARSRHPTDLLRFTQRNILRVYPNGTRVDSSNYNPMIGWMYGAQMVAFNMQGYGKSLWLMQGMFRANGGCGYVKKPDILMHNQVFNPKVKLPVRKTLKVRLYMGDGWRLDYKQTYFDAYSPPDFYARVGIAGVPADVKMHKTKIMEDDWTPVWDKEFYFPLTVPELALLRVEVHEYDVTEKDDFGGQTCLPVWELRPGIRAVPLFSRKGEKLRSVKLLMQFQIV